MVKKFIDEVEGALPLNILLKLKNRKTGVTFLEEQKEKARDPKKYGALKTGFPILDGYLGGGLHPATLTTITARPGIGKTNFLLNILVRLCMIGKTRGFFYSLEMTMEQIVLRLLSIRYKLELSNLQNRVIESDCWKFFEKLEWIDSLENIFFFEKKTPKVNVEDLIKDATEKIKISEGNCFVGIDQLNLLDSKLFNKNMLKCERVGLIAKELKFFSMTTFTPIIAICQAGRDLDKKTKNLELGCIKDSGDVESFSDNVLVLTRADENGAPYKGEKLIHSHFLKTRHANTKHGERVLIFSDLKSLRMNFENKG